MQTKLEQNQVRIAECTDPDYVYIFYLCVGSKENDTKTGLFNLQIMNVSFVNSIQKKIDLLLMIIGLLSAVVVIGCVTVAVVAAVMFAKRKQLIHSGKVVTMQTTEQVTNPIYEGPLYETIEEQQSSNHPPTTSTESREITLRTPTGVSSTPSHEDRTTWLVSMV